MKALKLFLLVSVIFLSLSQSVFAKRIKTWQDYLSQNEGTTKIYVEDFINSSDDKALNIGDLKKALTTALSDRITHKFIPVDSASKADIILEGDIVEYLWTDKDPVDEIYAAGAALKDAMTEDDYARMKVNLILKYVPTGQIIWNQSVKSTITDTDMPEAESYSRTNEHFSKVFLRQLFKKPKK